jgi:hypothetical protein
MDYLFKNVFYMLGISLKDSVTSIDPWQFFTAITSIAFISLISGYFGAYIKQKGQDKAILEGLAEINGKIESIKLDHSKKLEDYTHKNRFQLVALEKRLAAYQQSYAYWVALSNKISYGPQEISQIVLECQTWFQNNCLYLDKEVGEAFWAALMAASSHHGLTVGQAPVADAAENRQTFYNFKTVLAKNFDLPAICYNDNKDSQC